MAQSVFVMVLLLLAPVMLAFRLALGPAVSSSLLAYLLVVFLAEIPTGTLLPYDPLHSIIDRLRQIMWEEWSQPLGGREGDAGYWRATRASSYVDPSALALFQSSLSCPELDSAAAVDSAAAFWQSRRELTIFDIGGGEGDFTKQVIAGLQSRGFNVGAILAIDPVDWAKGYRMKLGELVSPAQITFRQERFEEMVLGPKFSLVLASHSLYAPCDMHRNAIADVILPRLRDYMDPGGLAIVILGSARGAAYAFKAEAAELLYGNAAGDIGLTAETFRHGFGGILRPAVDEHCVDDVIDVSSLLEAFGSGNPSPLARWLSYFLRVELIDSAGEVRTDLVEDLAELLYRHCCRLEELCENHIARYRLLKRLALNGNSILLPHKVIVFALTPP
jgi:hypothetical protein